MVKVVSLLEFALQVIEHQGERNAKARDITWVRRSIGDVFEPRRSVIATSARVKNTPYDDECLEEHRKPKQALVS